MVCLRRAVAPLGVPGWDSRRGPRAASCIVDGIASPLSYPCPAPGGALPTHSMTFGLAPRPHLAVRGALAAAALWQMEGPRCAIAVWRRVFETWLLQRPSLAPLEERNSTNATASWAGLFEAGRAAGQHSTVRPAGTSALRISVNGDRPKHACMRVVVLVLALLPGIALANMLGELAGLTCCSPLAVSGCVRGAARWGTGASRDRLVRHNRATPTRASACRSRRVQRCSRRVQRRGGAAGQGSRGQGGKARWWGGAAVPPRNAGSRATARALDAAQGALPRG
jgi:hypothetical protein